MNQVLYQCCFCDLHLPWAEIIPLTWEETAQGHRLTVMDHPEQHFALAQRYRMKFLCNHCFDHLKEAMK